MYTVKVIKSEHEHEQALARLMALMDANPQEGSSDADELEKFKAEWTGTLVTDSGTLCEVKTPITELDQLTRLLGDRSVVNFEERKMSLQKHFMDAYKKGGAANEKN